MIAAWLCSTLAMGQTWRDGDGDGYGDPDRPVPALHPRAVGNELDCDDDDATVNPDAIEICDQLDNDCNGLADDDDPGLDLGTARTFYLDADLDSVGTPATVLAACSLPPGYSPQDDDCDDAQRTVHPRAREFCDGIDNDCDGDIDNDDPSAENPWREPYYFDGDGDSYGDPDLSLAPCTDPTPDWVTNDQDCDDGDPLASPDDHDGDTFGVCAGDCDDTDPAFSPAAVELCDGIDLDCDAHPDDSTVAGDLVALGCDLCPRPEDLDELTLDLTTYNPCVLDPTSVQGCSVDTGAPDSHTSGAQLHTVVVRNDLTAHRAPLFLFLGQDAAQTHTAWLQHAAHVGYKAIQLGWPNHLLPEDCPGDPHPICVSGARREAIEGTDLVPDLEVGPQDSIAGRLATLLTELDGSDPARGWGAHLDVGGAVDWSTVVVAGWDGAAGHAAMIAQLHSVHSALLLSGPEEDGFDALPWATDPCRIWAVYHVDEIGGPHKPTATQYEAVLRDVIGLTGDIVAADKRAYPWSSHVLKLTKTNFEIDRRCAGARSVADDACIDPEVGPKVLNHLLCLAAEGDPVCP